MKFLYCCILFLVSITFCIADDWNEFKVKRENNFTFTSEPVVNKTGENLIVIGFETASFCDVTVVVEEKGTGRVVRHLASGILGGNAPVPFAKNNKKQSLEWDCKDDKGAYVKSFGALQVRVSLGLDPKYERDLFTSNDKRYGISTHRFATTKNGVYVYDGGDSWDYIRLYDFDGNYLKTSYPISALQMQKTKGIELDELPDKNGKYPLKTNFLQNSFLKDGSNSGKGGVEMVMGNMHYGMYGKGASFIAANDQELIVGMGRVHFIGLNNQEIKPSFYGPSILEMTKGGKNEAEKGVPPLSAALSTDGSKAYFTGYHYGNFRATATEGLTYNGAWNTYHVVNVLDIASGKMTNFKGQGGINKAGADNESFNVPIYVFVDAKDRVYVADYLNDRVQIFDASGKFLKSIAAIKPSYVTVLNKSNEIVIGSSGVEVTMDNTTKSSSIPAKIMFCGTFDKPIKGEEIILPKGFEQTIGGYLYGGDGLKVSMVVADDLGDIRIWLTTEMSKESKLNAGKLANFNVVVYKLKNKKLELVKDFNQEAKKDLVYDGKFQYGRKRIYINPKTGNLFHATTMWGFVGKAFKEIIEIDVKTGKQQVHKLPFDAEDMAFDSEGFIYLKSINILARYEIESWREVPFDYGVEAKTCTSTFSDRVVGEVISGLKLPFSDAWHHGGMYISPKGYIVTSGPFQESEEEAKEESRGKKDNPRSESVLSEKFTLYPGRAKFSKMNHLVHIYDKYGKQYKMDLLAGLSDIYGIGIDQELNVYLMSGATRVLNGEKYKNLHSGTIIKLPKEGIKVLSEGGSIPLKESEIPKRAADVVTNSNKFWVNGAEWYYGGVGFSGKNTGVGCACFNAKMAFDYLNRTFAPELERYRVAVLDSAGNLICHIGQYGNIDSKGPKSLVPVGGDEVTMMHGAYLATDTDKFLYIADPGNDRVVKVKLGYSLNKIVDLPEK